MLPKSRPNQTKLLSQLWNKENLGMIMLGVFGFLLLASVLLVLINS